MGRAKRNTTSITKVTIMYYTIETGQISYEDPVASGTPAFSGWGSLSLSPDSPTVTFYVQPYSYFKLSQTLTGELFDIAPENKSIAVSVIRYDERNIIPLPSTYYFIAFSEDTSESHIYHVVGKVKKSSLAFYFLPKDHDYPEITPFYKVYQFLQNCAIRQAQTKFHEFLPGDLVYIPALGIYGTVVGRDGKVSQYVVKAEMFGRTVEMKIHGRELVAG